MPKSDPDRSPGWHFHDPHDILHEMPYTVHWKAAATDVCDISMLFGPRPRVAATNDGSNGPVAAEDAAAR